MSSSRMSVKLSCVCNDAAVCAGGCCQAEKWGVRWLRNAEGGAEKCAEQGCQGSAEVGAEGSV